MGALGEEVTDVDERHISHRWKCDFKASEKVLLGKRYTIVLTDF